MNKRAAAQYLDQIFGNSPGHVAAAYKDRDSSWQEAQFAWPGERAKFIAWADIHADANVFICPALRRDKHTRKKGDMQPTSWLWADVDMQNVPAAKRGEVETRISELGTLVVRSGSGDNVHVYVNLGTPVDHTEHIRLNTGLKDYLYADNKQADNSLLRLPGTTNWKTDRGAPVTVAGGTGRSVTKTSLLKRRAFRDVKVVDDWEASDWDFVEAQGLPRRVIRLVEMTTEEALGRYGKRHKAVWAITKELIKRAYDPSLIHSLMHTFPPALSKAAEENGYDVHRDVDKCLAYDRVVMASGDEADEMEALDDEAYERARDAETDEEIERWAQLEYRRSQARRRARQLEAERGWTPPPPDTSYCLSDALSMPPDPMQYLIEDLCSAQGIVVVTGQYKTGKTHLVVASLLTSLANNEPFLGIKDVFVPEGGAICGHWNLEMSTTDLVDKYMRPAGFKHPANVFLANWQGYRLNILTEPGKLAAIEWLTTRSIQVWTIDSWSALCHMCGVDPNDNKDVGDLMAAVTEIKVAAKVQAVFLIAHISRSASDSDRPGSRGASALDESVDTRWMFTVDSSDLRWMRVEGRGTRMDATSLIFDEETGRSTMGTVSRSAAANDSGVQLVVEILTAMRGRGLNKATLSKRIKEVRPKTGQRMIDQFIEEAVESNFVEVKAEPSNTGRGRPQTMHYLTATQAPEDDRVRRATPGVVNLTGVKVRGIK